MLSTCEALILFERMKFASVLLVVLVQPGTHGHARLHIGTGLQLVARYCFLSIAITL